MSYHKFSNLRQLFRVDLMRKVMEAIDDKEKKKLRPRFELPPPHQLPPFVVGRTKRRREEQYQPTSSHPPPSTAEDPHTEDPNEKNPSLPCHSTSDSLPMEVALVNLYHIPFMVQVEALRQDANLNVSLYRLDRSPLGRGTLVHEYVRSRYVFACMVEHWIATTS